MSIKNGVIQVDKISGIPFYVDLIPTTNKKARPGKTIVAKGITVHNTGNPSKHAGAKMHTQYVDSPHGYSSWHFTVDQYMIYQELPINEESYHAGDGGNGQGNMTQISIEICENANWSKARENGIKLIVWLINNVFQDSSAHTIIHPHKKWSGKYCPRIILNEGWTKFLADVDNYRKKLHKSNNKIEEKTEEKPKKNWIEMIKEVANEDEKWEKGLNAIMQIAKEKNNTGDLEIFKHLPELVVKLYNH